ncbi:MAG: hypothetical protein OXF03_03770 [Gammaproteobacteria bacterium]|nr:hypothetical protein [Gammaproteobacteria bacterium]
MRAGLIVVLVLLLVAVAAQFLAADAGYVLISFQGWAVEMTVPVLIVLLALLLFVAGLLRRIRQAPRRVAERAAKASARRTGRHVARGLAALGAGRLARAERLLAKSAGRSQAPVLQYLAAARLAHGSGDAERRDHWFSLAGKAQPDARDAIALERAELHLAAGEQAAAMSHLAGLLEREPRHLQALRLFIPLQLQRKEWGEAARCLKALRKHGQTVAGDAAIWAVGAYVGLLGEADGARRVQRLWGEMPRDLRGNDKLALAHARALMRNGAHELAEQGLRRHLDEQWNSELAAAYGALELRDIPAAIRHAESWLAEHPQDPALLLALGRLCRKAKLWGKARSYIETSLGIEESRGGWLELAEMLEALDDKEGADAAYRKGLRFAVKGDEAEPS